jgi:hypothetical protein
MPLGELLEFAAEARELYADWEEQESYAGGAMRGLEGKVQWYFDGVDPREWVEPARRVYAEAKFFDEEKLRPDKHPPGVERRGRPEPMDLTDLAKAFGEQNLRAARSRWSWRIRKAVNEPMTLAGLVARAPFQKSAAACRSYAASARGNQNRRGSG